MRLGWDEQAKDAGVASALSLGLIERDARKWATFAYSTFLGTLQLRRDNPSALPAGPFFNEYLRLLIETLIPRPGEQAPAASAERAA